MDTPVTPSTSKPHLDTSLVLDKIENQLIDIAQYTPSPILTSRVPDFENDKFIAKVAEKWTILGYFEERHFYKQKLLWLHFGLRLLKIGLLFIPTSGHTDNDLDKWQSENF